MDITLFLFAIAAGIMFCIIRFFQQKVTSYERVFLAIIAVLLAYGAYDNSVKNNLDIVKTRETVQSVLSIVSDSLKDSGLQHVQLHMPIQKVLESDAQLLKALLGLVKYAVYDKSAVVQVLKTLVEFYDIYADVLLEAKPVNLNIAKLIDLRYNMLQDMHSLFVSLPQMKNARVFEYITLILSSTTYKALNVLKNKYGISQHETPLPNNISIINDIQEYGYF